MNISQDVLDLARDKALAAWYASTTTLPATTTSTTARTTLPATTTSTVARTTAPATTTSTTARTTLPATTTSTTARTTAPATTTSTAARTTIPATTKQLISQQLSKNVIEKQNNIITALQAGVKAIGTINIEGFTNPPQQSSNLYQPPLYLPSNNLPELNDYISAYNKSIALLDDPNRITQANFDAYVHLQDNKIAQLQAAISSFPTNPQKQNNPIRSIKNFKTSVSLNLEPYPDPASQTNLPSYYVGNGAPRYPNYLIYANNGCLQYSPSDASNKEPAAWSVRPCNSNLAGQRFNMQQINNMEQYNSLITNPNNASYKISEPNSSIFGFYVVNPEGYNEQCLQLNGDGLSVMPCNMDSSQRFKPYYHSIKP
jgi:uncharacterized protein (DUF4415 family)